MFELLAKINEATNLYWELLTDGRVFTLLCEGIEVTDTKSGIKLSDMPPKKCETWLRIILVRLIYRKGEAK